MQNSVYEHPCLPLVKLKVNKEKPRVKNHYQIGILNNQCIHLPTPQTKIKYLILDQYTITNTPHACVLKLILHPDIQLDYGHNQQSQAVLSIT